MGPARGLFSFKVKPHDDRWQEDSEMEKLLTAMLACGVWCKRHVFLPFRIMEWDGTISEVQVCPSTPILRSTKGRIAGMARQDGSLPDFVYVQYPDGVAHELSREHFFSLLVV
jgi:hypothetical protein